MLENWLHAVNSGHQCNPQIMENEYVQHVNAFQEFMRAEANGSLAPRLSPIAPPKRNPGNRLLLPER